MAFSFINALLDDGDLLSGSLKQHADEGAIATSSVASSASMTCSVKVPATIAAASSVSSASMVCSVGEAATIATSSAASSAAMVCSAAAGSWTDPRDATSQSLKLWLRGDRLVTLVSGAVSVWADGSSSGLGDFQQSGSTHRGTMTTVGGQDAIHFGDNVTTFQWLYGPSYSSLTAAEIFIVYRLAADPPSATQAALMKFGTGTVGDVIPYNDGHMYDSTASTTRHDNVRSGTPFDATTGAIYNVISTSSEWTSEINGTQLSTTGTNTVAWDSGASLLGATANGTIVTSAPSFVSVADIAEVIIFGGKLSSDEHGKANAYLKARYGIA